MAPKDSYFVHGTAIVDNSVEIGSGTKVWHFSHISEGAKIGENCTLGQNVYVGPGVSIGNECQIQNQVNVYEGVILEDRIFCGPSMTFTNVYTPRAGVSRKEEFGKTLVRKGASLGAGSQIICGRPGETREIGKYAFVGAGAVVQKNIPDYSVVVGIPSRQLGWACECGEIVSKDLKTKRKEYDCGRCGEVYVLEGSSFSKK